MSEVSLILHPVQTPIAQLERECTARFERRRGPGGQHRNKTESAVVLLHNPTGIEGQASERRSQHDNRRMAIKRLRVNMALSIRTVSLAEAAPSPLWKSRTVGGRIACNPDHDDFAPLLAEVLDVLQNRGGHLAGTAEQLGVTASQIVKFLQVDPRAIALVNEERRKRGLRTLE